MGHGDRLPPRPRVRGLLADVEATLEFPVELGFRACGYLFAAHSEAVLERLRANVAIQNAEGVPSRIVSPEEAARSCPGCGRRRSPEPRVVTRTATSTGRSRSWRRSGRGADVRIASVHALRPAAPGWELDTSAGKLAAGAVVVAAGRASVELVAGLGIDLPIENEERHLFLSLPIAERLLEPLVVSGERAFAAKQLGDGRVLASDLAAAGAADEGAPRWRARVREGIRELLPRLEYVDFPILATGTYDITPDRQPILGAVPGHERLYVAAGFSGHGFMIAPAVGRILADAVEGRHDPILDVLDAARFADGRPVHEPQVV